MDSSVSSVASGIRRSRSDFYLPLDSMAFLVAAPLAFHAPALAPVQQLPAVTMKAQGEIGVALA